jgi:hypothetical protein
MAFCVGIRTAKIRLKMSNMFQKCFNYFSPNKIIGFFLVFKNLNKIFLF